MLRTESAAEGESASLSEESPKASRSARRWKSAPSSIRPAVSRRRIERKQLNICGGGIRMRTDESIRSSLVCENFISISILR